MDFWTGLLQSMLQVAISPTTAAFALAAIGLNLHFGFTGLMNMGQAGFMLVGAYGFAISTMSGAGFFPALLISILASSVFAIILGIINLVAGTAIGALSALIYNLSVKVTGGQLVGFTNS